MDELEISDDELKKDEIKTKQKKLTKKQKQKEVIILLKSLLIIMLFYMYGLTLIINKVLVPWDIILSHLTL